jgi:hypothetical protein
MTAQRRGRGADGAGEPPRGAAGGWIATTVLVSLLIAIVVAALPARAAARIVPAAVLRQE